MQRPAPIASVLLSATAMSLGIASFALATPTPNSAIIRSRVFNDCSISVLTITNNYPLEIRIDDQNQPPSPACAGFANLHTWRFSTDATNPIEFQNGDGFEFSCTLVLNGAGEGGLSLSPWWGPDADGLFNVRSTDGEIACFGGRLPFFSFTGSFGLVYVNNTPIELGITYIPNGLSAASPAQIVYNVRYNNINYSSGLLNFNQGNAAEDPPHGLWGALTPWYAGGHIKMFAFPAGSPHGITGVWSDIQSGSDVVSVAPRTWSRVKELYR